MAGAPDRPDASAGVGQVDPTGTIGVLALQGGFASHARVLNSLGANVREVRVPEDLVGLSGLVLPGGESTTMMLGIEREHLAAPIAAFVNAGNPVLATCAGTIILDDQHLALLDISSDRNAYGGQVHSFESDLEINDGAPFCGVFIRAPRITRTGGTVETLIEHDGEPVAIRSGKITAVTFHPELTSDDRIHRIFLHDLSVTNVSDINKKRRAA